MRSIGIFGGSFNPVHQAHLIVAERVREALALDRVLFVPAALQPLKGESELATAGDRLEMLRLALAGNPVFEASAVEFERGGPSYTVDTLAELRAREADAQLFLILGSDTFRTVHRWKRPDEVRRLARLVIVPRPGSGRASADEQDTTRRAAAVEGAGAEPLRVEIPALGISASDIRDRVARGQSIRYLVPEAVRVYILERGLYR